ncbi:hypothetical protein [uncultured Mediterranean phage uvDeep-CGR2-KM18-C74]|nr:hypothetical protein [uncultured Mediterranean phage uvDeep-CGR2-KM18-C74]
MPKKWFEIIRIRPQVLTAILILGVIAIISIYQGYPEISGVAGAGVIALAKDVVSSDSQ